MCLQVSGHTPAINLFCVNLATRRIADASLCHSPYDLCCLTFVRLTCTCRITVHNGCQQVLQEIPSCVEHFAAIGT